MTTLTSRFAEAVDYARIVHEKQKRKGGEIPYLYHLLGVASIALQYGGDEDQAIAALLHDTIEDGGAEHEARIREKFGDRVANIVVACTDATAEQKAAGTGPNPYPGTLKGGWLARKWAYLDRIDGEPLEARFVCACDKLHNALSIVGDMEALANSGKPPKQVLDRFSAPPNQTLSYYLSLTKKLRGVPGPLSDALFLAVKRMHDLTGSGMCIDLDEI